MLQPAKAAEADSDVDFDIVYSAVYVLVPLLKEFFTGHFSRGATSGKAIPSMAHSPLSAGDVAMNRMPSGQSFGFDDSNTPEPLSDAKIDIHFRV